jgi:hypothetical protein
MIVDGEDREYSCVGNNETKVRQNSGKMLLQYLGSHHQDLMRISYAELTEKIN